jgi:perosamine synthetase
MPARMQFDDDVREAVDQVFDYYNSKSMDFGYQNHFEDLYTKKFVEYLGCEGYADAVCSGTAGLYIAVASLQLEKGSHIIVGPTTDPGTINAIILNGHRPVVIDSKINSFNIGSENFANSITSKTKAAIIIYIGGEPTEIDEIITIAHKYGIKVIEDCSQAHGAIWKNKKVGTFGDISVFSTMYSKNHSTGGTGGVIYTKHKKYYNRIRSYADRGKPYNLKSFDNKNPGINLFPALNLNQDEISCSIGIVTLSRLDTINTKRIAFIKKLKRHLEEESKICSILKIDDSYAPFFQPVLVDTKRIKCSKIEFATYLWEAGIDVNTHYKFIVPEWKWMQRYINNNSEYKNVITFRNNSFNLLFNENYSRNELKIIMKVVNLAEKIYIRE